MSRSDYSLSSQVYRTVTSVKRPDVPWQVVLRSTAAVVLPLAAGIASGHQQIGLGVAAGALNTMFADQPGPYRQRLQLLMLTSAAAALASLVGFLIGGHLLPILAATALLGFCGGMLVVFGTDTARVGMISMILLVITAATPTSLASAVDGAALIFGGGLLLTAFSLAAWPWQRYRPERHALAGVYRGLAVLAQQDTQDQADAPALTDSMTALQHTLLGRHRSHGRAMEAFGVLLELAERIRLELIAIAEVRGIPGSDTAFRADAGRVLNAIGTALDEAESPLLAERALDALQTSESRLLDGGHQAGLASHVHALTGQLAAAVRNADWAGSRGELRARAAETQLPKSLRSTSALATLRANLTPRSIAFRHAVRTAVCLSLALWLSRRFNLPHGYWLPMTAAIVLRSDFAATLNFGLLRVLGTVLGLILTTILLHFTPSEPWAHLALMALLCMGFRYLATAHYGFAVAALTGTVVILLSFEGVSSSAAVSDRVINTALGCGMAMLAYLAWPTWERGRARAAMAGMLDAYANYLRALASPAWAEAARETRTAARTARTNAQASLERARAEPATPPHLLELANAAFANGNRLARTAMTFEALRNSDEPLPAQPEVEAFVEHAASQLTQIAAALRHQHPLAVSSELRARQRALSGILQAGGQGEQIDAIERICDRLTDNIDTLAHAIARAPVDLPDIPGRRVREA
jgi:uncharacterized membrane protein YccC